MWSEYVKRRIERALSALVNCRFHGATRAANMACFAFGPWRIQQKRRGPTKVARFSLHVQCPWRIRRGRVVLVASEDRLYPVSADSERNFDEIGSNLWDQKMEVLRKQLRLESVRVETICADSVGGLTLRCSSSIVVEIFPASSAVGDAYAEHWRFFETNVSRHVVLRPAGLDAD
jgi:hypothetical protein